MTYHRILTTLAAGSALALASAAPAMADSIAYVKAGDVWLTSTDGSRQFQVTSTGGIQTVAQADDGTLLVTNGARHLVRLDRLGNVLSEIATPVSVTDASVHQFFGPFNADISPSGQTLAYGWVSKGYEVHGGVMDYEEHNGTGFSRPDALTGFTDAGFKYSKSWDGPEFIDDHTVLEGNGPGYPSNPIAIETVGSGDPVGWFVDPGNMHPLEPTISRNKRVIATVVGPDRQGIRVYRDWDGQLLGTVSACFTYGSDGTDGAPAMESPTLSADGSVLAYSDGHDLMVAPIGDMTTDCPTGVNAKHIATGAASPDWGPADVPASRPAVAARPAAPAPAKGAAPAPGAPQVGDATHGGAAQSADGSVRLESRARKLSSILKRGLPLTIHAPAGRITVTASAGGKVVAKRTVSVGRSGEARLTLRLTKKSAARLRKSHGVPLQVTAAGGGSQAQVTVNL